MTNFREDDVKLEARSRGAIVNAFLTQLSKKQTDTESFIDDLVADDGLKGVGGFSLVCGKVGEPLAVISNRTPNVEGITWIATERDETNGLSNAAFANRSWPKVLRGEKLLSSSVTRHANQGGSEASLIEDLFKILSDDTLPKKPKEVGWESFIKELRHSIFIPALAGEATHDKSADDVAAAKSMQPVVGLDGHNPETKPDTPGSLYGTQKQTVLLVNHQRQVTFVERTLYDEVGKSMSGPERDRTFRFNIE